MMHLHSVKTCWKREEVLAAVMAEERDLDAI